MEAYPTNALVFSIPSSQCFWLCYVGGWRCYVTFAPSPRAYVTPVRELGPIDELRANKTIHSPFSVNAAINYNSPRSFLSYFVPPPFPSLRDEITAY